MSRIRIKLQDDLRGLSALSLPERLPVSDLAVAKSVVLSMGDVRHMDQAGVAMLVRLYSQLRVRGSDLMLTDVRVGVRQTLERVGLAGLVSCAGPVEHVERKRKPTPERAVRGAQAET